MWFVSTPSLVISFVLAIFYVASLVFYAVNRQQEQNIVDTVKIEQVSAENEHPNLIYSASQDTTDAFDLHVAPLFNAQCSTLYELPDITTLLFDLGFCWNLLSRPPPMRFSCWF